MKTIVWVLVALLVTAGITSAIEPTPLPAFSVIATDGKPRSSGELNSATRWLLLYMQGGCVTCEPLLHELERLTDPVSASRVILIAGNIPSEALPAWIQSHEKLTAFALYADTGGAAYHALPVSGLPMIMGIQNGVIMWSVSGTPWDSKTIHSLLSNWIR